MYKAIIFDIGDVITHGDFSIVYEDFAKRAGVEPQLIKDYFEKNLLDLLVGKISIPEMISAFGLEVSSEEFLNIWKEETIKHWSVDEKMLQLLRQLKKHYTLVALTNLTETRSQSDKELGVYDYFGHVLLSFKEGMRKPNPAFFELALSKAGVSADEAVYIDDQPKQVEAATAVGLKSLLFKNYEQLSQELKDLGIRGL